MNTRNLNYLIVIIASLLMMSVMDGCSCGRRRDRSREHRHERTERSERRSESRGDRRSSSRLTSYTAEEIQEIAESDDYDRMLDCLQSEISAIKAMKNRYFNGELTDKQAEEQAKEIRETYAPVYDAIERAGKDGNLNYKQHKRQLKLFGEYLKLMNSVMNRLGSDFEDAIGF